MCQQNKQIDHVPAKQTEPLRAHKTKEAKKNDHEPTKQTERSRVNKT